MPSPISLRPVGEEEGQAWRRRDPSGDHKGVKKTVSRTTRPLRYYSGQKVPVTPLDLSPISKLARRRRRCCAGATQSCSASQTVSVSAVVRQLPTIHAKEVCLVLLTQKLDAEVYSRGCTCSFPTTRQLSFRMMLGRMCVREAFNKSIVRLWSNSPQTSKCLNSFDDCADKICGKICREGSSNNFSGQKPGGPDVDADSKCSCR